MLLDCYCELFLDFSICLGLENVYPINRGLFFLSVVSVYYQVYYTILHRTYISFYSSFYLKLITLTLLKPIIDLLLGHPYLSMHETFNPRHESGVYPTSLVLIRTAQYVK